MRIVVNGMELPALHTHTRPPVMGAGMVHSQFCSKPIKQTSSTYQSSGSQSRKPLAKGLLAIFSSVIYGENTRSVG